MREATSRAALPDHWPNKRRLVAASAVTLVVLLAVWAGFRNTHSSQNPQTSRSATPEAAAAAPASAKTADANSAASLNNFRPREQPLRPSVNDSPSVLHEEIPDVPRSARDTIHGRIKIAVRVAVDSSGSVTSAALEKSGPSNYFARLATAAAKKWKFAPANNQDSRKWLLRFEFTRGGTIGHASIPPS
jgi:TonB family protein